MALTRKKIYWSLLFGFALFLYRIAPAPWLMAAASVPVILISEGYWAVVKDKSKKLEVENDGFVRKEE